MLKVLYTWYMNTAIQQGETKSHKPECWMANNLLLADNNEMKEIAGTNLAQIESFCW